MEPRFLKFLLFIVNYIVLCESVQDVLENITQIEIVPESDIDMEYLEKSNFLAGILSKAARQDVSTPCARDSRIILDAIQTKKLWAIKLFDAFGTIPPPFTWGNNFWFPPKAACVALNHPIKHSLSPRIHRNFHPNFFKEMAPFPMAFIVAYANFTSPYQVDIKLQIQQVLHIGLCVPTTCSVKEIYELTGEYFEERVLKTQKLLDIEVDMITAKSVGLSWEFLLTPSVILAVLLVASITILPILSFIHSLKYQRESENYKDPKSYIDKEATTVEKFLHCFDFMENFKPLFTWRSPSESFGCLAGMRVCICFWIVALHTTWYPMFTYDNTLQMVKTLDEFVIQPFYQAFLYVDVFFVISAFLLTYNFLRNETRLEEIRQNSFGANVKLYAKMALSRYLRLAPLLIGTTILSDVVYTYLDIDTPFYANPSSDLYCKENWWYNLLLINNVHGMTTMCVSWGWYIACDMQFFLLFTFILFIHAKNESFAKALYLIIATTFISICFYLYYINGITFAYDILFYTSDTLYTKPWTRMCSYIGGVFMGWLMFQIRDRKFAIRTDVTAIYWTAAFLIYFVSVTMTFFKDTPVLVVALIMSVGRAFFGIYIGSMIIMCEIGYGGYFNDVMSANVFVHLSQFCYAIYLVAPIHLTFMYGFRRSSSHFDEVMNVYDIPGSFISSYIHAILAVALLETPMINIAKKFVLPKKRK